MLKALVVHTPVEVFNTSFSHTVMDAAHGLNQLVLGFRAGHNVKVAQEVVSHRNQGVSGPALEPVHGAARDQPRELEGSLSELCSDLLHKGD